MQEHHFHSLKLLGHGEVNVPKGIRTATIGGVLNLVIETPGYPRAHISLNTGTLGEVLLRAARVLLTAVIAAGERPREPRILSEKGPVSRIGNRLRVTLPHHDLGVSYGYVYLHRGVESKRKRRKAMAMHRKAVTSFRRAAEIAANDELHSRTASIAWYIVRLSTSRT